MSAVISFEGICRICSQTGTGVLFLMPRFGWIWRKACEQGAESPDLESRLSCFLFEVTSGSSLNLCEPQYPDLLDSRTERKPAPLTWPVL